MVPVIICALLAGAVVCLVQAVRGFIGAIADTVREVFDA